MISSTTRAVAWGALWISMFALGLSFVTFFLTWRDGRLVQNAKLLSEEISTRAQQWQQERAQTQRQQAQDERFTMLRERIERVQEMVSHSDSRSRFYIDALVDDMRQWSQSAAQSAQPAISGAIEQLEQARQTLAQDGPAAAERLKALARQLETQAQTLGADLRDKAPSDAPSADKGTQP